MSVFLVGLLFLLVFLQLYRLGERLQKLERSLDVSQEARPKEKPLVREEPIFCPIKEEKEDIVWKPREEKPQSPPFSEEGGWEQVITTKLGVWVGAAALILGALFFVKYSIEQGLLSPAARLGLSALFGCALIAGAERVSRNPKTPNGPRLTQAFAGVGFAVLYAAFFAAHSLYHLISAPLAFAGLAFVTGAAVLSALRYGLPVGLLGVVGGLIVPLIVRSETPSVVGLFSYLFAVNILGTVVGQKKGWWILGNAAFWGGVAWAAIWLLGHKGDSGGVLLFFALPILGLNAWAHAFLGWRKPEAQEKSRRLMTGVFIGVIVLFFLGDGRGGDPVFWAAFYGWAFMLLGLNHYRNDMFQRFVWPVQIALIAVFWMQTAPSSTGFQGLEALRFIALASGGLALLFAGTSFARLRREKPKAVDAWILTSAVLGSYLVAYGRIKGLPFPDAFLPSFLSPTAYDLPEGPSLLAMTKNPFLWGGIALGLAGGFLVLADYFRRRFPVAVRSEILAPLAFGASAMLASAIVLVLPVEAWSTGLALQALATLWIYKKTGLPALLELVGLLFICVVVNTLSGVLEDVVDLFLFKPFRSLSVPSILVDFLVPGLAFIGCFVVSRGERKAGLSAASLGIAAVWVVLGLAHLWTFLCRTSDAAPLFQTMGHTLLVALAACAIDAASSFRKEAKGSDPVFLAFVIVLILRLFSHLFSKNPLLAAGGVGDLPVLNVGLLGYILPLLPIVFLAQKRWWYAHPFWGLLLRGGMPIFFMIGGAIIIKQLFHHTSLIYNLVPSVAEKLSYSALGLFTGIGVLVLTLQRKDAAWRWVSLLIVLGTTAKVFFVDAAHLTGLWRVLSFIGLGFALIGLSAFYSKFVFKKERA